MQDKRRLKTLLRIVIATVLPFAGTAAGELKGYGLSIAETGDSALDEAILSVSQLEALRDAPPDSWPALIDRARGDVGRIETALGSFGYYRPQVSITLDDHSLDGADTLSALEDTGPGKPKIVVAIDKGALYHLRRVSLIGDVPPREASVLGLKSGDAAVAATVLGAGAHLQATLREDGYAFARVAEPDAVADDGAAVLDVSFPVTVGRAADVGTVRFSGLGQMDEAFVRQVFVVRQGDAYHTSTIDRGRQNLLGLGSFAEVTVAEPDAPDADGNAPVNVTVVERQRHRVALSANYSTDLGSSLSASWSHRNLLGEAEQLNLSAAATGLGGSASSGVGYNFTAQFIKPYFLDPGQQVELVASAIKQDLDAYDQTAEIVGGYLQRRLSTLWTARAGMTVTFDDVAQADTTHYYQLFALPLSASFDSSHIGVLDGPDSGATSLADPKRGFRATLSVTPTVSLGRGTQLFAQMQVSLSRYFDIFEDGKSVLALRGLIGSVQGASNLSLPPDQRLYAGGSGTVRGYRYQSIGPTFSNGDPAGATSVDAGTIEWRQRVWGDFGVVGFFDVGQAGTRSLPFNGGVYYGVGGGLRYYTPIGALRLDAAVPLSKVAENDSFQIYISIGQAF
ncbi:MAG: BamA/TamA family outer membrane protein [Rhizomicrobium sp.]